MLVYLVNQVLPEEGNVMTVKEYRNFLMKRGYSFYQAIGSLGGASAAGTIVIQDKIITRLR